MNCSLRKIFAVAMAAAMPLTLFAQTKDAVTTVARPETAKYHQEPVSSKYPSLSSVRSKAEKVQAGEIKILEQLRNAYSYFTEGSPYVYDGGTNAFFRVQRGTDDQTLSNLYLITSTDKGSSWSAPIKYYDGTTEGKARYPSVQIHNKNKSKNIEDISYVFYAPVLRGEPEAFDGGVFGFKLPGQPYDMFHYQKPDDPNPDKQRWSTTTAWATDNAKTTSYMIQTLSNGGNGKYGQSGQYGFVSLNSATGDVFSYVPPQWGLAKFRDPGTDKDASFNSSPHIGIDEEGTLYVLLNNLFVDDQDNRVPAISKSTDGGKTWSELERMPASVLLDYQVANGGVNTATAYPGTVAYNTNSFAVLGKDKYSFVTEIIIQDNDANTENPSQLVEFYRENSAWGIRKVADITRKYPIAIYEDSTNAEVSDTSSLYHEVQLIRTADNQNLIVKYVDIVPHNIAGQEQDSITDIFYSMRTMQGGWSTPQNITNDVFFDKLTWLPSVIPDLNNIPMIQLRTISALDPNSWAYFADQRRVTKNQEIIQRNVSFSAVGVEEEQNPVGLALHEAYPNPASTSVELPFSVEHAVDTKIELYTTLGEKVAIVQSGLTAPGFHAVVLNTENLTAGTYYYTLTAGTAKLTKMLSIVR